ncbi:hypothetical protein AVEN_148292-1 [Araneus ventricosus]|uniref:Receptor ligand binding region domain-containing protein n=1 Tax=Araneus ventricosus TaxID=182803 RepID=A0A4Y2FTD9_ARAVE|nr:hypothetical protein AVEN_148292-1 [Araneus ventricosus]
MTAAATASSTEAGVLAANHLDTARSLPKEVRTVACGGTQSPTLTIPIGEITYADTHPMYTKENYPNFFRAVPSETAFNPARVALLKYYNWTRVGTLYQNSPRYDLPHSKLLTDLDSAQIMIAETQGLVEELQYELMKLKVSKIILSN